MIPLETLRESLACAEDEVFRAQMADPFAFTNGSYDAALRVVADIKRRIKEQSA